MQFEGKIELEHYSEILKIFKYFLTTLQHVFPDFEIYVNMFIYVYMRIYVHVNTSICILVCTCISIWTQLNI